MSENSKEAISVYTSGITNLVTITAAGLAASTALMQIVGYDANNKFWYLASMIVFFFALIFCFITMAGLTGQATKDKPSINVPNIRVPALIAFFGVCIGFILLGTGAFSTSEKATKEKNADYLLKLESCYNKNESNSEGRLKCYDSFVEMKVNEVFLTDDKFKKLSEKDSLWVKSIILKLQRKEEK